MLVGNVSSAQSQKEITLNKEVRNPSKIREINDLRAVLKIDTVQKESEKGLQFSIKIQNDSTSDIIIKNPVDFIGISLSNSAGREAFIQQISRFVVHTTAPHKFGSFVIERIMSKGKEVKSIDMANTDSITIPAKDAFEIFFNINKVNNANPNVVITRENQHVKIPSDIYKLYILFEIISVKTWESDVRFTLPSLTSLTIRYGL
jgi:hypothetical protein